MNRNAIHAFLTCLILLTLTQSERKLVVVSAQEIEEPAIQQTSTGWQIERIRSLNGGANPSLSVDSHGYPHVSVVLAAGSFNRLAYYHKDASGWSNEMLSTTVESWVAPLVLDGNDFPHIVYFNYPDELVYTFQDSQGWHTETKEMSGSIVRNPSLDLDAQDVPHFSFYDQASKELKYAYRDSEDWRFETVTPIENIGYQTPLRLDHEGRPHIGYYDGVHFDFRYAHKDESGWQVQVIDQGRSDGGMEAISLALDPQDRVYLTYKNDFHNGLHLAQVQDGVLQIETVTSPEGIGWTSSIVMNEHSQPLISNFNTDQNGVELAYKDCSGWQDDLVEGDMGGTNYYLPVDVTDRGTVFVAYVGEYSKYLTVASKQIDDLPISCSYLPAVTKPFPIYIPPGLIEVNLCDSAPILLNIEGTVDECVKSVEILTNGYMKFNFSWTVHLQDVAYVNKHSDRGNTNMYVYDNLGNYYYHVEVGGAADEYIQMYDGDTLEGWFLFQPARAGASVFTFRDADQGIKIEPIDLLP
jgi:hypothetical protein